MNSNHYHTIIIGAGPAGLSCAESLAQHGKKVLVLEKQQHIGPKICAGGITYAGTASAIPNKLIEKEFRSQQISSHNQQTTVTSRQPIVSTINRAHLGEEMALQASNAGVEIKSGCLVKQVSSHQVDTDSASLSCDFLVGADGANSLVRRFLKIPVEKMGMGIHYHVLGEYPNMVWHLDPERFNTGYSWIFPQAGRASVGAYCSKKDLRPSLLKKNLHSWLTEQQIDWHGCKLEAAHINFDFRGWQFGTTFLVGDAAGLASGLTGEGILPAIISGQEAAQRILNPAAPCKRLNQLIKNHRRHTRLLMLAGRQPLLCKVIMESLILALRFKLIHFSSLEMAR